ncbi:MAG: cation-translocating P-type ATPase [Flavobacteriales bacterium]|nr:cation-translocating P-type ATPase [Flavobacteriales bacterium]|tara:strand:- start:911 stop:3013 length:2103 start_codon:yes stop_codon:yes gene_type:complete
MTNANKYQSLNISGMTCANCAKGIEKHLSKQGIKEVNVDFSNSEAHYLSENTNVDYVIKEIESIGFKAKKDVIEEKSIVEKLFAFCLILTIPLFSHMFINENHILQNPILQFFLALPVYIVGCYYFGRSAWNSLKIGVPNMDVLIMMGTTAAFFYSISGTLIFWGTIEAHQYLFFETTATIITLVLLGNVLEHRSVKQTTSAIKDLSSIQNLEAKREKTDGTIETVSFKNIVKEDILLVNSGDKVPTDGTIISGEGYFDESMMTGESHSILKKSNEDVVGGTILLNGNIKMIAKKVGEDTVLSHIIKLIKKAQSNKPNIQRLGDKVSSIFVPVVLLIAILTFTLSYLVFDISLSQAIMRSIAVLVISCPCAMGLATPTAVMVGLGRAAKNGILIKGGNTLEEFAKVKNIVFDKTGTLTTGNFKIDSIDCEDKQRKEVVNLLYSLELHSSHPIAKSIIKELENEAIVLELEEIKEIKGQGIQAKWKGDLYKLGSAHFVNHKEGKQQLFLFKNNGFLAGINCSDEIKENLKETILELNKEGLSTTMLSGDKIEKCKSVGNAIGIYNVYGEHLPHEKLEKIDHLNKQGLTAMIGDGINDAPALAKAHVGISLGGSTEVAIESAQIVLLNTENLKQITLAYKISKHTLKTIKQNLFWAFSYNIVAIPIAALGFLNPMWGALFMAFSDVIVIGNSLRLKRKNISK